MPSSSFTAKFSLPDASSSASGLMSAQDKKRLDALYNKSLTEPQPFYPDSGRHPTVLQSESGYPPNTDRVFIDGKCREITLLPSTSLRHAQIFINGSDSLVKFTSPEGIIGYKDGYFLSAGDAITFVREPHPSKSWRAV